MITTRLYLDTRQSAEGRPAPLKISIFHKRQVAYLSTGIKLLPSSWDPVALAAKDRATMLNISRFKLKVDTLLLTLLEDGKLDGLTAPLIRDLVKRELNPADAAPVRFMECLKRYAMSRPKKRTTEIYMATYNKILQFDRHADVLQFQDITTGWLDRFDAFLVPTSPKRNARNIHYRNIRAVFNYARREKYTMCYPFVEYVIRPEPTMKKALSAEQLRTLFTADVPEWQRKYIDFFQISFLLVGMNTEDLTHAIDINAGRLEYRRAKTYKPYSIKVEPECQRLMERHPGKEYLLDVLDHYSSTHNWTSRIDRSLKEICLPLGLPPISMYWARHSWATIAAELEIPNETIAAAMGHSANTVTEIYIKFDRNKIDRANRQVIDYVLYNKKNLNAIEVLNLNLSRLEEKMKKGAC